MSRKKYDPLQFLPSPGAVREQLQETLALAERLKILLEVSERVARVDASRTNFAEQFAGSVAGSG